MEMDRSRSNQKLKIVYLMKIFMEKTDETHDITLQEIIQELERYDVTAERKSIYSDIEHLRNYGLDIVGEQYDRTYHYRLLNHPFELAELKLLVDCVQAARFISTKKSNELIKKIEGCASKYEAQQLQRQVYINNRVKTMNERVFYSVDTIHEAINKNVDITFQYFNWNVEKKMELRHDGQIYQVSPYALAWEDENYYMIAYDATEDKVKHFRVDKMLGTKLTGERRKGQELLKEFDMASYTRKMFGMFDGQEENVKLVCHNRMAGIMIDRFGQDIKILKKDAEHFETSLKVAVSRQFLAWIISLGEDVRITGPQQVVERITEEVIRLNRQYLE